MLRGDPLFTCPFLLEGHLPPEVNNITSQTQRKEHAPWGAGRQRRRNLVPCIPLIHPAPSTQYPEPRTPNPKPQPAEEGACSVTLIKEGACSVGAWEAETEDGMGGRDTYPLPACFHQS